MDKLLLHASDMKMDERVGIVRSRCSTASWAGASFMVENRLFWKLVGAVLVIVGGATAYVVDILR